MTTDIALEPRVRSTDVDSAVGPPRPLPTAALPDGAPLGQRATGTFWCRTRPTARLRGLILGLDRVASGTGTPSTLGHQPQGSMLMPGLDLGRVAQSRPRGRFGSGPKVSLATIRQRGCVEHAQNLQQSAGNGAPRVRAGGARVRIWGYCKPGAGRGVPPPLIQQRGLSTHARIQQRPPPTPEVRQWRTVVAGVGGHVPGGRGASCGLV